MKKYLLPILVSTSLIITAGGSSDDAPKDETTDVTAVAAAAEEVSEDEAEDETIEEDSGRSDEEKAADYEAWLKGQLGVESFTQLLTSDPSLWGGWINGFDAQRDRMHVRLQIDRNDSDSKDFAKQAATAIASLVRASDDPRVENVDWVVVDDGAGVYIAQESI